MLSVSLDTGQLGQRQEHIVVDPSFVLWKVTPAPISKIPQSLWLNMIDNEPQVPTLSWSRGGDT